MAGGSGMKKVRLFSLVFAVVFAVIGLVFLLIPGDVLVFFNHLSGTFGLPQAPVQGAGFYLVLAAAYMYLVTVLACLIYRHPEVKWFPLLLANGKLASSALSLFLFVSHQPYLIYITNCIVDGLIGFAALLYYLKLKREPKT
jgi:hypothetical protein